jgi:hypothetical protein
MTWDRLILFVLLLGIMVGLRAMLFSATLDRYAAVTVALEQLGQRHR